MTVPTFVAEQTLTYQDLLAGHAIFTIASQTGVHHTYRIVASEPDAHGRVTHWVNLLTGSDNETAYTYLGVVDTSPRGGVRLTRASKLPYTAATVQGVDIVLRQLRAGEQPKWCQVLPS